MTQNQIGATNSYGTIWMNTASWTGASFSTTTAYQELTAMGTNFTLASPSKDFSMTTDGRMQYTGNNARTFMVSGYLNTTSGANIALAIFKNGVLITGAESYSGGLACTIVPIPVSLIKNDYVSLFVKVSANGPKIMLQLTLSARSVI